VSQPAAGPNWLEGLDFAIIGQQPAGGGGGASGGGAAPSGPGFAMSTDEARNMLVVAKRVRDKYSDMRRKALDALRMNPPADEPGSNGYNKLMVGEDHNSGVLGGGRDQVELAYNYAAQLASRLEQALGITESSDAQATVDVKNMTQDEGKGFA
jgi:hypothetical protein